MRRETVYALTKRATSSVKQLLICANIGAHLPQVRIRTSVW
jgi:hypothetical protein